MDLTRDPILDIMKKMAIPTSVGFFFQTMFNVVDTYFAGKLSTTALAALSISFPVFFMIIALGAGLSQGTTALIANAMGSDDTKKAQILVFQTLSFSTLVSIFLTIVGLAIAPSLLMLLGARDDYLNMALAYINIVMAFAGIFILQSVMNAILVAQGKTKPYRNALIVGFFLNLLLDPWFLYGGFGLPAMGIAGVAWATVIIQIFGLIYLTIHVRASELWCRFEVKNVIPQWPHFKEIAVQGIPASINMMTIAAGIFVITYLIGQYGKEGVAAYGIATRVEQIILLPTIGLNSAVLALVGQNNGAKLFGRIYESWQLALKLGGSMMAVGGLCLFFTTEHFMRFFTEDLAVVEIGAFYLKIAAVILPSYVLLFVTVSLLQGLKRPMYAIWSGLFRQVLGPITLYPFLAANMGWGLHGIWWGIFVLTWSTGLVTLFYGRHVYRTIAAPTA